MSLPLNGDGSSSKLFGSIYLRSHFLAVQVISPLSSPESQHLGEPSHTSFSIEQLPSSITLFTSSLTTPFITSFIAPPSAAHVAPSIALAIPFLVVPFDLPFDATPFFQHMHILV